VILPATAKQNVSKYKTPHRYICIVCNSQMELRK